MPLNIVYCITSKLIVVKKQNRVFVFECFNRNGQTETNYVKDKDDHVTSQPY